MRVREPEFGPWDPRPARAVAEDLVVVAGQRRMESGRTGPVVVAVDGRSGSGKSTVANLLVSHVPDACLVHTDDIAWHHSFFGWVDLLVSGVLAPAAAGGPVAYQPPGWTEHGREGAVVVPPSTQLLVVEGVGSSRQTLRSRLDAAVWVQSDEEEAFRRGIGRDVDESRDREEAEAFWAEWAAQEDPFLAQDRPWEHADVVVCGTPRAVQKFPPAGALLVSAVG